MGHEPGFCSHPQGMKYRFKHIHQAAADIVELFHRPHLLVAVESKMGNHAPLGLLPDIIIQKIRNTDFQSRIRVLLDTLFQIVDKAAGITICDTGVKFFLGVEIGINRRFGNTGGLRDFRHAHPIIGLPAKHLPGSINDDLLPHSPFLRLHTAQGIFFLHTLLLRGPY